MSARATTTLLLNIQKEQVTLLLLSGSLPHKLDVIFNLAMDRVTQCRNSSRAISILLATTLESLRKMSCAQRVEDSVLQVMVNR